MIKKIVTLGVSLIVTVLIFSSVIIPAVNVDDGTVNYWQYDDYVKSTDSVSVSGAFELLTIGGEQYIHAKEVGTGTIDGKEYIVHKAELDLAFICGQSNAAYRNANVEEVAPIPKLGTSYYFGLSDRCGPLASENDTGLDIAACEFWPMVNEETGDLRVGDKAPAYCATYYEKTGHKVYWVCGAIGNKPIMEFVPPNGGMWEYMDTLLDSAINLIDTTKFNLNVNYYLWCQGEGDSNRPVSTYKTLFLEMHNGLINGLCANQKFKGAIISETRPENGINSSIAQRELAAQYDTIFIGTTAAESFTVSNGLMGPDDLHYSQRGNNIIGKDLATFVANLEYPPNLTRAVDLLQFVPIIFLSIIIGVVGGWVIRK